MEIAIENDFTFSARRQKRTMALRSRLITELNHLFTIMNDMSSDDNLSNEDVNHSISLTLAQSDSDSLWWLISDLTLQLRDADCIMADIREVMLLILTHYAQKAYKIPEINQSSSDFATACTFHCSF